MIRRGGNKVIYIPGDAIRVTQPAAAVPWWLSGGIAAANCVAAYQPKGAVSLSASYVNLANPGTYDAAPGVAPPWDGTNGWGRWVTGSRWLTTGYAPGTNRNISALIRFSGGSAAANSLCGVYVVPKGFIIQPYLTNNIYFNTISTTVAPNSTAGVLAIAGNRPFRNGIYEGVSITQDATNLNYAIYIGALNSSGTPIQFYNGYIQAFALYGAVLSDAQVLAVSTAMAAL